MTRTKTAHRALAALAGLSLFLVAGAAVLAAENTRGAGQTQDTCGAHLQQIRADMAKEPAAGAELRAQVDRAAEFCQRGDAEQAKQILDRVAQVLNGEPKTRTN